MKCYSSFIFNHLSEEDVSSRLMDKGCKWISVHAGEDFLLPGDFIGIIEEGRVDVHRLHASGKRVLMNQLSPGHVFGLLDLFLPDDENHIQWHAKGALTLLCISGDTLMSWMQNDQVLLKAYMAYVNGRVRFLNSRIECFTLESIKDRVAYAMDHPILSSMNRTELAEYLGISRASLYRILKSSPLTGEK